MFTRQSYCIIAPQLAFFSTHVFRSSLIYMYMYHKYIYIAYIHLKCYIFHIMTKCIYSLFFY